MKLRLALLSCLLAVAAFAADVTGKWTAEVPGRDGAARTITMNLKADGDKLTGTVGSPMGETDITDGRVDGDTVSFTIVREMNGNSVKINYTGKVSGDEIQFKMQPAGGGGGRGSGREFTAKRATST
jgi:hypothetical protein